MNASGITYNAQQKDFTGIVTMKHGFEFEYNPRSIILLIFLIKIYF